MVQKGRWSNLSRIYKTGQIQHAFLALLKLFFILIYLPSLALNQNQLCTRNIRFSTSERKKKSCLMLSIDDNIWSIHLNVHNMLHCLIVFWRLEITSFKVSPAGWVTLSCFLCLWWHHNHGAFRQAAFEDDIKCILLSELLFVFSSASLKVGSYFPSQLFQQDTTKNPRQRQAAQFVHCNYSAVSEPLCRRLIDVLFLHIASKYNEQSFPFEVG